MPIDLNDRVVSIAEAADLLGISIFTLRRRARAGAIAILKLSPRRIGVRLSEVQRYMDATVEKASPPTAWTAAAQPA
jgi:predicted site-specific integrase-resolvase